jgi:hypothetical protein
MLQTLSESGEPSGRCAADAATIPAVTSSESPGRKKPTSSPVSTKTIVAMPPMP